MLPDVSLGAVKAGLVQPKITQAASIRHRIKRSRELFMGKNRNSPDANTSGGSVKGGAIAGATVTKRALERDFGGDGKTGFALGHPYNIRQYMSYKIEWCWCRLGGNL